MSDDRIVRNAADLIAKPSDTPGSPRRKVYGVPRRFGMGTIFVVMTAFALLFGILKSWAKPPTSSRRRAIPSTQRYFNSILSWSILAARMKSFSDSPPMAWVQSSTATLR